MDQSMLAALYAYNTYANELVLETAARLTEAEFTQRSSPSRESVKVLLRHLLMTETFFLESCLEHALLPEPRSTGHAGRSAKLPATVGARTSGVHPDDGRR